MGHFGRHGQYFHGDGPAHLAVKRADDFCAAALSENFAKLVAVVGVFLELWPPRRLTVGPLVLREEFNGEVLELVGDVNGRVRRALKVNKLNLVVVVTLKEITERVFDVAMPLCQEDITQ